MRLRQVSLQCGKTFRQPAAENRYSVSLIYFAQIGYLVCIRVRPYRTISISTTYSDVGIKVVLQIEGEGRCETERSRCGALCVLWSRAGSSTPGCGAGSGCCFFFLHYIEYIFACLAI